MMQHREDILNADFQRLGRKPGHTGVAPYELRMSLGFLHANRRHRSAAQTFQAQRACACEQFEHPSAHDACAKAVEHGLFDQVRRRAHGQPFRDFQDSAANLPTGDAHGQKSKYPKPQVPNYPITQGPNLAISSLI
jgi:hypothetical protein